MPAERHRAAGKTHRRLPTALLPGIGTHAARSGAPPWAEPCPSTRAFASPAGSVSCLRLSPRRNMLLRSFRIPFILRSTILFHCTSEFLERNANPPHPPWRHVSPNGNHHIAAYGVLPKGYWRIERDSRWHLFQEPADLRQH